jgi:predicted adenine nucleotide alpha hydrolase (AANH) superfamily ATPase
MEVKIIEKETGRIINKYSINWIGGNYTPDSQWYFDEAWRCAVDDKLVEEGHRDNYTLTF